MRQEKNKKEIVVTLSEQSVDDLANDGGQILNNMEMLLKPIYEEIQNIKSEAESIESDTRSLLFSNYEDSDEDVE